MKKALKVIGIIVGIAGVIAAVYALVQKYMEKQQQIDELQSEVNNLEDKTRVLGMLGDEVKDNQDNVYIIN